MTSFANPAITVGRMFSASFAGISPASVPGFVAAQIIGGGLAVLIIRILYPAITAAQADIIVPHHQSEAMEPAARVPDSSWPAAGLPSERQS